MLDEEWSLARGAAILILVGVTCISKVPNVKEQPISAFHRGQTIDKVPAQLRVPGSKICALEFSKPSTPNSSGVV